METYDISCIDRSASALTLSVTIVHPDVVPLPLPGHRPSWARLLLLADPLREWETLKREEVWGLADTILKTECLSLENHPRLSEEEQPRVVVRLHFEKAPEVPDGWPGWITFGDDWAADWDDSTPERTRKWNARKMASLAPDAKGRTSAAQRVAELREAARDGIWNARRLLARYETPEATQALLDQLHRGPVFTKDPVAAPTFVVLAGQSEDDEGLRGLGVFGREAGPLAANILDRIARRRGAKPASRDERRARWRCLGDEGARLEPEEEQDILEMLLDWGI